MILHWLTGLDRTDNFQKFCGSGLDRIQFHRIRTGLGLKNFTVLSSLPDSDHLCLGLPDAFYKDSGHCGLSKEPDLSYVVFRNEYSEKRGTIHKILLIKHLAAVVMAVWLSISDPVEFFYNPVRSGFKLQNLVGSRSVNQI